jgi:hypothetical protein
LVRLYYMAYHGTATHRQMIRLGTKSGAAALFAGNTPDGELARAAGADKTTLARLSAGLSADAEIDLAAAFKRRGEELAARLAKDREWIGASDTLAARLAARALPTPLVESIVEVATPAGRVVTVPLTLDLDMTADAAGPITTEPLVEPIETVVVRVERKQPVATFGDMDDIANVLRKNRKQRRAMSEAAIQAGGQLALF